MNKHNNLYYLSFLIVIAVWLSACSKVLDLDAPKNQLTSENVFSDSSSAVSALGNIYYTLANSLSPNLEKHISLYADEYAYTLSTAQIIEFQQSRLTPENASNSNVWTHLYFIVYSCNDLIERVSLSESLSSRNRTALINEARFLRAYAYFYLQNLYGNVPLLLHTDVVQNRLAPQVDESVVFSQILQDLTDAKRELSESYPSAGKARANRWAAASLLARTHLYLGNWQAAESEATETINSGHYAPLEEISTVFHAGSREAILQLWTQNGFVNDATALIPASATTVPQFLITDGLQYSFEDDDLRNGWLNSNMVTSGDAVITYPYPYKYKNRTANTSTPEYLMILRLGEQYLIRAEARAQQGNVSDAVSDINIIRGRAGLPPLSPDISQTECLEAIIYERRIELFGEWGHRFLDLKRKGNLDDVIGSLKDTWDNTASVLPIPQNEIIRNPNLIQNQGY